MRGAKSNPVLVLSSPARDAGQPQSDADESPNGRAEGEVVARLDEDLEDRLVIRGRPAAVGVLEVLVNVVEPQNSGELEVVDDEPACGGADLNRG